MSSVFEDLQKEGKILAAQGRVLESLQKFQEARRIKETPKVLHRIQKLKDFIAANGYSENVDGSKNSLDKCPTVNTTGQMVSELQKTATKSAENKEGTKVLQQIQNVEGIQKLPSENQSVKPKDSKTFAESFRTELPKKRIPENPNDLSSEDLKTFNALKKKAMELSYVGNFSDAMETFLKALQLCACPKVKKHYQAIKLMATQHAGRLHEVQNLTNTGKKLAMDGNQVESLKKLKEAYNVCPSPSISKMIKTLETQNTLKHSSGKGSIPFGLKDDSSKTKTFSTNSDDFTQNTSKHSFEKGPMPFGLKDDSSASKTKTFSTESDTFEEAAGTCDNPDNLSPEKLARFKSLYEKAKKDAADGKLQESLKALLKAKSICASSRILKRIKTLQEHIKNSTAGDGEGGEMVAIVDDFYVFHEIYKKLYPYQREGVAWMWGLFKKRKGGVLGDDMGLGKTFQVIAFLSGLIDAERLKHALIIMPVSLIPNWQKEFKKWCPGVSVHVFHGGSKAEKERSILRAQRRGHVLLTSYGMVVGNLDSLTKFNGSDFVWDYVILDEGHKIKNPTKTTKAVHGIPSRNRLVLTGTPVQNNLRELWALYDFVHLGTLLGSMKTFKMTYENIITRAREKDATAGEKRFGTEMADNLKKLINPYFLRRTKAEVFNAVSKSSVTDLENKMANMSIQENKLARKNDLIMWVYLSKAQCEIYENFLHSEAVKQILVSKRSPLVELTILKKICDHPRLLSRRACLQLGLNEQLSEEDINAQLDDESSYSPSIEDVSDETLIAESGKMKFLINLLDNLRAEGHRTLVFSLSRKILDMVHRILNNRNWKILRIDGTISKIEERERRIQLFQKDSSYSVFLLTTQVGGVGITLTAADRVIIYDPSWNPATDAQAVDRVYRIGQQKNVVVYRLITCGSVEEKIYRRQVFKDSITRQATGSADPYRYFSKQELRELFQLDNPRHSATQVQLSEMHSNERQSDTKLDGHIAFLYSLNIFGISDHDLMFSKNVPDHTEDNDENAICHDHIKQQVMIAQARIQDEAAVVEEGIRLAGSYFRPFSEQIQTFKSNTNKDYYIPPKFPDEVGSKVSPSSLNQVTTSSPGLQQQSYQSSESKSYTEYNASTSKKYNTHNSSKKQDKDISVVDICSDESDSFERDDAANIEIEHSPKDKFKRNSLQLCNKRLSKQSSAEYSLLQKDSIHNINNKSRASALDQSGGIVNLNKEKSFSEVCVSNKKDNSRSADTSVQFDLHESVKIENYPVQIECVDNFEPMLDSNHSDYEELDASRKHGKSVMAQSTDVPVMLNEDFEQLEGDDNIGYESKLEQHDTSIADHSNSEEFGTSQKQDSVLSQATDVPVAFNEDFEQIECDNVDYESKLEHDTSIADCSNSEGFETSQKQDSVLSQETDVPIAFNEDFLKNPEEISFKTECHESILEPNILHSDVSKESVLNSEASPECGYPATVDCVHFTKENVSPIKRGSDFQNKSLFQEILETSTPMPLRDVNLQKDLTSENSNILEDISFDEKPIRKSGRKSCVRQREVVCDSDSSSEASELPSLNNSYEESVPDSEEENLSDTTANSTRSDIFDTSEVVPSSIQNSPFSSNVPRMNQSLALSLSKRITPLRLRDSYVSPRTSAFALAMARSPVIDTESFLNTSAAESVLMDSASEVDSPVKVQKKKRRVISSESEEDSD